MEGGSKGFRGLRGEWESRLRDIDLDNTYGKFGKRKEYVK